MDDYKDLPVREQRKEVSDCDSINTNINRRYLPMHFIHKIFWLIKNTYDLLVKWAQKVFFRFGKINVP